MKARELEREVWVWELLPGVAALVNGSGRMAAWGDSGVAAWGFGGQ